MIDNKIDFVSLLSRFDENQMRYEVLELQDGARIVISQHGGRIFGPFLSDDTPSLNWINAAFADKKDFQKFLQTGDWNIGGDRIWIAPEIQYATHDRFNFYEAYDMPQAMDPGHYCLTRTTGNRVQLSQDCTLEARVLTEGKKVLRVTRLLQPIANPLRYLTRYPDLMKDVRFIGYEHHVTLQEFKRDDILSEAWSLIQLNPGGTMIVPVTPGVEINDYYRTMKDHMTVHPHHIHFRVTGDYRYKMGLKAATVFGRAGYYHELADGQAYLIVRNYFNNPSAPYIEEIDVQVGSRGRSFHIYNDDGKMGGFAELEVSGQAIGGDTGRSTAGEQLVYWSYIGTVSQVKKITTCLLGAEL